MVYETQNGPEFDRSAAFFWFSFTDIRVTVNSVVTSLEAVLFGFCFRLLNSSDIYGVRFVTR